MIKKCRVCGSGLFTPILSLGDLYQSYFIKPDEKIKFKKYPLSLVICDRCMLVQLKHTMASELLYTNNYGYYSGISNTMRYELAEIVASAEKIIKLSKKDLVIDIGANDGTLLKQYKLKDIIRVGFDPVGKFEKEYKSKNEIFINSYFNKKEFTKCVGNRKAKIITAISMFYDLDDPNTFLLDVKKCLDRDGIFIIQQNYLVSMLSNNAYDNIVHEHLEYYSLISLRNLLARHGFEIFDVEERGVNGGSFRTYIKHSESSIRIKRVVESSLFKERRLSLYKIKIYKQFAARVKKNSEALYGFIKKETKKGKSVYVYGASTRGNTLLQYCGIDSSLIVAATERNPEKYGKKIASVNIPIISEIQARKDRPDYMLVLPWYFKKEFLQREREYLASGGKFIFPLPTVRIYQK